MEGPGKILRFLSHAIGPDNTGGQKQHLLKNMPRAMNDLIFAEGFELEMLDRNIPLTFRQINKRVEVPFEAFHSAIFSWIGVHSNV